MIQKLHLKLSSPGRPPLVAEVPHVTIFVGPNNAGKSQCLREMFEFCRTGTINSAAVIFDKLIFNEETEEVARADLEKIKRPPRLEENVQAGFCIIQNGPQRAHIPESMYLNARQFPNKDLQPFANLHLAALTINLDGTSRINLVGPQGQGDLKNPNGALPRLLTNDVRRARLRKTVQEAVGLYVAIDMSEGGTLHVRFGESEPPDERTVHDSTLDYMRAARGLDSVSDGVKAYTGIMVQVYAGDPRVIIIDEPEAFLHPSLAFSLGKELAKAAASEGKYVFAATHSSQFVMGAIQSGANVNIIRLTYEGGIGTARLLPSEELTALMQDPLLRSVGVLSGLFYNHVIVGEADADRSFYQEINERLLAAGDDRGIPHTLFLNADNKQTIPRIVEPLRKLGIPAAAVVDIDVLKEGGVVWTRQLKACSFPEADHHPFSERRSNTLAALTSASLDFKRSGLGLLSGGTLNSAGDLFDDLARYGLFVLRRGEIEAWLPGLDVPRSKHLWLHSIFEKMGSDPASADYARPESGDVWDFMGQIGKWLTDPKRRGIPE